MDITLGRLERKASMCDGSAVDSGARVRSEGVQILVRVVREATGQGRRREAGYARRARNLESG